ncbi:MAG TPA: hypothetical protein VEJ20_09835 [Candidatus Eremiobacteraceae bacterium]|nr:hypothetical protein [Candidatus Eremiobacteraceae bacterium]
MRSAALRFLTAIARTCAAGVALIPIAVAAALIWNLSLALGSVPAHLLTVDFFRRVAFTLEVAAGAGIVGGGAGVACAIAAQELVVAPLRGLVASAVGYFGIMPAAMYGWYALRLAGPLIARTPPSPFVVFVASVALLSLMALPTACALASRALNRVPDTVRHAAAAAGATRIQTTALVVVPALRRSMAAAAAAAVGRAAGEAAAMVVLLSVLSRASGAAHANVASWILTRATESNLASAPSDVAPSALLLVIIAAVCAWFAAREQRAMQWAEAPV